MPYILSPPITDQIKGQWNEGHPYSKNNIYNIQPNQLPPVNYDEHILRPHSLTHAEGELHVVKNGKSIDQYFKDPNYFFGSCIVIKLLGNKYKLVDEAKQIFHWEIELSELKEAIERVIGDKHPSKILVTTENYPTDSNGFHDANYVLTLSQEAATYLDSNPNFNLYGTSWKSTDFKPGSKERPIHKIIFKKAIIFELLDLKEVPEGEYFFVGFPLNLVNASESPVTPVLFTTDELNKC